LFLKFPKIMQLVLDTKGLEITKKGEAFHVKGEKGSRTVAPAKLSSIAVTASVMISSEAIMLAVKHKVPILFFNRSGKAQARLWSPYFESIATLRRQQVRFADSPEATAWMADLFSLKMENQIDNLRYLRNLSGAFSYSPDQAIGAIRKQHAAMDAFRDKLLDECRQQMMGVEGAMARAYWQAFGSALPGPWTFQTRSKRPAKDLFNAGLNYLYGMLYSVVESALFSAGLDPHLGFLHADEYDKPTLTFDLIEPFRPWIDRLLVQLCFEGKMKEAFFARNQYGIFFNKEGKGMIIPAFNDFLRSKRSYLGQESTVRNHIFFMAGRLAQRIRVTMGG